ncbi:MAG: dynamin family protein [Leptolyngbya sp. DLM2.Bin15]|nr:MAG: dynamin family protein [Leptolyngbya sp. DLM2.Bin15]
MSYPFPQCDDLQAQVNVVLQQFYAEPQFSNVDTSAVRASLKKAIAPEFEIVFAGAFSAGKSMLINAILERELLYSAEGHATGTECKIAYAPMDQERVVLTFMSEAEVREQVTALCQQLGLPTAGNINNPDLMGQLQQRCSVILEQEGGESKSERAKQASGLKFLLEGFTHNRDRIHSTQNNTFSMEQFNFTNLQEAAAYARRGANSAVLKRIEYYCHHPLLEDGNVLVDTPGIDAPVQKDAALTYSKIEHPDTSAVICVLKPAAAGDMSTEETQLLETIRTNPGIRDRVFYVFNRVDETWYNAQLRQRLDQLLQEQFPGSTRVFKTSALLGFYGSQIRQTQSSDRFGLDSVFVDGVRSASGLEETPQFVSEFNRYCANSGKLSPSQFRIDVRSYETPNQNYVRILGEQGSSLINQLIHDSGIEGFRTAITRYLVEEKRPQLLANLADDLQPLCIQLRQSLIEQYQQLQRQPQDVEAMKEREMQQLGQDLKHIGDHWQQDIEAVINAAVASDTDDKFEQDFNTLRVRMVARLDELIHSFSVADVHRRAQSSHRRNSVVPLLGILAEAFYYLANGLEDVLVDCSQHIVESFFDRLGIHVKQQDYYSQLYRLLGKDGGIEQTLAIAKEETLKSLLSEAQTECDRYVRERPEFYTENSVSLWQLRQTLQQACRGYDYKNMIEAESAIRQLLQLDFEQKVNQTVAHTFRQTINQTLNHHLLSAARHQSDLILQQYDIARQYLARILDKEASEKLHSNQLKQEHIQLRINDYNTSVQGINACLEAMMLDRKRLPLVAEGDLAIALPFTDEQDREDRLEIPTDAPNEEMPVLSQA